MQEILPGIFEVKLYSEKNARGKRSEINIFIIKGDGDSRSLMVDAGYHTDENKQVMTGVLKELGISCGRLDVFLTHKHHDHTGLANFYAMQGAVIHMNPEEDRHPYDCLYYNNSPKALEEQKTVLKTVGVTPELTPIMWKCFMEMNRNISVQTSSIYFKEEHAYEYRPIHEGQIFSYGGYDLEAFNLRGHTYGQMGLIEFEKGFVFSADQVIEGINPIVGTAYEDEHLLDLYFKSLNRTRTGFYGYQIMPAHGSFFTNTGKLVDHIKNSYERKIDMILKQLADADRPLTVREVAFHIYKLECEYAEDDLMTVKMCITKTFSCLEYLHDLGEVVRTKKDGVLYWTRPGFKARV